MAGFFSIILLLTNAFVNATPKVTIMKGEQDWLVKPLKQPVEIKEQSEGKELVFSNGWPSLNVIVPSWNRISFACVAPTAVISII